MKDKVKNFCLFAMTAALILVAGISYTERNSWKYQAVETMQEKQEPAENETVTEYKQDYDIMPGVEYESMITDYRMTSEDEEVLLRIAMAEAEGEGVEGMALVMLVTLNRVVSEEFPDCAEDVVLQSGQYEPVQDGRYYTAVPSDQCHAALRLVKSGWDRSMGALYFDSTGGRSWAAAYREEIFKYGNHTFYR